jgi:hypothetical protein
MDNLSSEPRGNPRGNPGDRPDRGRSRGRDRGRGRGRGRGRDRVRSHDSVRPLDKSHDRYPDNLSTNLSNNLSDNFSDKCLETTSRSLDDVSVWTAIDKNTVNETFVREYAKILREQSISKKELIVFFRNHIVHVFKIKVFGSAVMSMFSGIEPNDIDLYVESKQDVDYFSEWMHSRFGHAFNILQAPKSTFDYTTISKFILKIGQIDLKIDVVTRFNLTHCFTSDFIESRLTLGPNGFELLGDPEIRYSDSIPWLIDRIKKNLTNKTLTISASHCIPGVSHLVHDNKFRILQRVYAKKVAGYRIGAIDQLDEWNPVINELYWSNCQGDWTHCRDNHKWAQRNGTPWWSQPFYTESMRFTDVLALPGLECIVNISVHEMNTTISSAINGMCDDTIKIVMSYLHLYDPVDVCTYCNNKLGQCDLSPHMKSMCLCDPDISHSDDLVHMISYNDSDNEDHKEDKKPMDPRNGILCKRGCNGCQYAPPYGRGGRGRGGHGSSGSQRGVYYDRTDENFGHGFKFYYNRTSHVHKNPMSVIKVFHFDCFTKIADSMNPMGLGAPCNNICNDCYGRFIE